MSDYTQVNDYSAKDALTTGNPLKLIKGSDVDQEFAAISTAIATKFDSSDIAAQAVAEAGTNNTSLSTPLRVAQYVDVWKAQNGGLVEDIHALADPGADRILFWDDSAGAAAFLTVTPATGGIEITGTDLRLDLDSLTTATLAGGDEIAFADASDTGLAKKATITALATRLETDLQHDNLTGFVADEHVAHSSISITAGAGLTGGGTIDSNVSLAVSLLGIQSLADPNADRILFWDDSAGAAQWLSLGTGLSISTTTLNAEVTSADIPIGVHAAISYDYNGGAPVTASSVNVSSVTRTGTGKYQVNFTSASGSSAPIGVASCLESGAIKNDAHIASGATGSITVHLVDDGGSFNDSSGFHLIVIDPSD